MLDDGQRVVIELSRDEHSLDFRTATGRADIRFAAACDEYLSADQRCRVPVVNRACHAPVNSAHNDVGEHDTRNKQERNEQEHDKALQGFCNDLSLCFLVLRIGGFALDYGDYDEHEQQNDAD